MSRQKLIDERDKLQFHSDLAFGKIVDQKEESVTVPAGGTYTLTHLHTYPQPPELLGWAQISGTNRWTYYSDLNVYTSDEYGYDFEVYPFSSSTQYGYYFINKDTTAKTITLRYWIYFT